MAASRQSANPQSIFSLVTAASIIGCGAAIYFGYPGLPIVWLGLLLAAFAEPYPVLTGKDASRSPIPANPAEAKALATYRLCQQLRFRLAFPVIDALPGWPVRASWVAGVATGLLATALPTSHEPWIWANAVGASVLVWVLPGAYGRSRDPEDPAPPLRFDTLDSVGPLRLALVASTVSAAVFAVISFVVLSRLTSAGVFELRLPAVSYAACCAVLGWLGCASLWWHSVAREAWQEAKTNRQRWSSLFQATFPDFAKNGGPVLIDHHKVGAISVDVFQTPVGTSAKEVISRQSKFAPALGQGMSVALLSVPNKASDGSDVPGTEHPSQFRVVTYPLDASPNIADAATTREEAELVFSSALAHVVDSFGQDGARFIPCSVEALHQEKVLEPAATGWARLFGDLQRDKLTRAERKERRAQRRQAKAEARRIAACELEAELDEAFARRQAKRRATRQAQPSNEGPADQLPTHDPSGASKTVDTCGEGAGGGLDRPAGAAWSFELGGANNISYIASSYGEQLQAMLGCEVLVNTHTPGDANFPGGNRVYVGALQDPETFTDESWVQTFDRLRDEATWSTRFTSILKQGVTPPEPHLHLASSVSYRASARAGEAQIHQLPFTIRQGEQVENYQKLEPRLATTLRAAPFVSVVGFPHGGPGQRHPQAFTLRYSHDQLPASVDAVVPSSRISNVASTTKCAEHWIIAKLLNEAFDNARLARPEVIDARPLSVASPQKLNLWKVTARLHGGVSLADVRAKTTSLTSSLAVPWFHVGPTDTPQVVMFVMGADYRDVQLLNPRTDRRLLMELEWQSAWVDAKLVSSRAATPSLIDFSTMTRNEKVAVLDFELPSGISRERVKGAIEKLKVSTRNAFVQLRSSPAGPQAIRLLVCAEDPMPFPASFDFPFIDSTEWNQVPFATGVDGEPVVWNVLDMPHLLVTGTTGSGKTSVVQSILYPLVAHGWDLYVADPTKACADFRFLDPWARSMCITVEDTSAMMDAVYEEVKRRRSLNGEYGVGMFTDLPADMRPRPVAVVIDEFTSLIIAEQVHKPASDDPEALQAYGQAQRTAALITNIGDKAGRIVREARSAGIHLILGAQRITSKTLEKVPGGETLRSNMARLLLGNATLGERQSSLKDPLDVPDLGETVPKGRGIYESGVTRSVLIQSWYDHPITEVLTRELSQRRSADVDKIDLSAYLQKNPQAGIEGAILKAPGEPTDSVRDLGTLDLSTLDLSVLEADGPLTTTEDEAVPEESARGHDDLELARDAQAAEEIADHENAAGCSDMDVVVLTYDPLTSLPEQIRAFYLGEGETPAGLTAYTSSMFGDALLDTLAEDVPASAQAVVIVAPHYEQALTPVDMQSPGSASIFATSHTSWQDIAPQLRLALEHAHIPASRHDSDATETPAHEAEGLDETDEDYEEFGQHAPELTLGVRPCEDLSDLEVIDDEDSPDPDAFAGFEHASIAGKPASAITDESNYEEF